MPTHLGTRLRRARDEHDLSRAAVAGKIGVSSQTIFNWENGKTTPDDEYVRKLEKVLGDFNRPLREVDRHSKNPTKKERGEDEVDEGEEGLDFAEWLRKEMTRGGLSKNELARRSKVSRLAIHNLLSGKSKNPQDRTRERIEQALGARTPDKITERSEDKQAIEGLGALTDFDPHALSELPTVAGVYVFYDVSDRPVYVGKAKEIHSRVRSHSEKFWFKYPIVSHGAYVQIDDETLRHQVEQVLIRFLKSNAVINKQSVEREDD